MIQFIASHICGALVIAHTRKATRGTRSYANAQPFVREGWHAHLFAHNGDLPAYSSRDIPADRFNPIGETDLEIAFVFSRPNGGDWTVQGAVPTPARFIVSSFAGEPRKLGPANFLYSDGEMLFVHGHGGNMPKLAKSRRRVSCQFSGNASRTPWAW
jgi:glutamine amidotransferase